VFSSYDWKKEPLDSLAELYRRRAQQLRDSYDYIILCYSGGSDSDNILHSFVDNNIQIDEVVSMINLDATGDRTTGINGEVYETAKPNIDELQKKQNFRYRMIDLTAIELDFFSDPTNQFDWIYKMSMSWTPNNVARESWVMRIKEWADLIHAGNKVCVVYGIDKPRMHYVNGKFCVRFLDLLDVAAPLKSRAGLEPYTDELFYWTPDLPEIVIKQAHVIKHYLQGDISKLMYVSQEKSNMAYKEYQGKKYWISREGMSNLLYPSYRRGPVVCQKSLSPILSHRDRWFNDLQHEHPIKKVWTTGIDYLTKSLPDYWKNDPTDFSKGIKLCTSPNYFIE
jgi:hypothetical protein